MNVKPGGLFYARRLMALMLLAWGGFGVLWAQSRIVSLSPTMTEIVYALGAEENLFGATSACDWPAKVLEGKRDGKIRTVGDGVQIDEAMIKQLKPDVILANTLFQVQAAKHLREKGYQVLHFMPSSLEDIFASIEAVGAAISRSEEARKLVESSRTEIRDISAKTRQLPKVRVYLELNHVGPWTVGRASPLDDLIRLAGGENIFSKDRKGVCKVSHRDVARRNPEIILSPIWCSAKWGGSDGITSLGEIYRRKALQKTQALRKSRVLYYDSALFKHEGPRQVLALKKLAYLLHPEVFPCPPDTTPWELGWIK